MSELQPDNLSKSDFKSILEASYMPQKKAASYMSERGYNYDPELSSMQQKVFISPTGQPVITQRGSTRVSDWGIENLNIATGGFFKTPRIKEAQQLAKETQEKYGVAPTQIGHSLGSYLAEKGAQKTPGSSVYTMNKAAGIQSVFTERPKNQYDYRTTLDIPSALSQFQSGGTSKTLKGSWDPIESHKIKYLK